jgi:hypothetical protein
MGGQACILYGAAEFSRDIDLAIHVSVENFQHLKSAFQEMGAERIFVPEFSEAPLLRGHACHFRCKNEEFSGLRIDIMAVMRGVDPFPVLWKRREEVELPQVGKIAVMGLPDLVKAKKTQRDKDWPMIRRLVENDMVNHSANPDKKKLSFWFMECRTPRYLEDLSAAYPEMAQAMSQNRPLLQSALNKETEELQRCLRSEEDLERELDQRYWAPLKEELSQWRGKGKRL